MSRSVFRQPPSVIEGIGAAYSGALDAAGVTTLAEMLRRSPEGVARLVPGAPRQHVKGWFAAAWLLRVDGVDPDIAEALVGAGVESVNALADAGLQTLERAMAAAVAQRKLQSAPSLYKLAELQRGASRLRSTGSVYGTATNFKTGEPLAGVVVSSSRHSTETAEDGYFELHGIDAGQASLAVRSGYRATSIHHFFVKTDQLIGPLGIKIAERTSKRTETALREVDGAFIAPSKATRVTLVTRTLSDMPDGTYLRVREISDSGPARLLHLFRTQVGREIQGEIVFIEAGGLPAGTTVGQILQYQNGALAPTDLSMRDVASRKLASAFGAVTLKTTSRVDPKLGTW